MLPIAWTMPRCFMPGCKSGYDPVQSVEDERHFFKAPHMLSVFNNLSSPYKCWTQSFQARVLSATSTSSMMTFSRPSNATFVVILWSYHATNEHWKKTPCLACFRIAQVTSQNPHRNTKHQVTGNHQQNKSGRRNKVSVWMLLSELPTTKRACLRMRVCQWRMCFTCSVAWWKGTNHKKF